MENYLVRAVHAGGPFVRKIRREQAAYGQPVVMAVVTLALMPAATPRACASSGSMPHPFGDGFHEILRYRVDGETAGYEIARVAHDSHFLCRASPGEISRQETS
jgi:hypothetical protein